MKKSVLFTLLTFICLSFVYAQQTKPQFYPSTGIKMLYYLDGQQGLSGLDTLKNPYTGGINSPMFSNIDLNHDGLQDLFIFDKEDNKVLTFLAVAKGSAQYIYAPQYEGIFPKGYFFATLVDYNHDGRPDFFSHRVQNKESNLGISLYKNVGKPGGRDSFTVLYDIMDCRDSGSARIPINVNTVGNAIFADVDGDHKVDLLTFPIDQQDRLHFYRNMSDDPEKIDLWYWDECWMKFKETDPQVYVPYDCSEPEVRRSGKHSNHVDVIANIFDVDGDGDMDMLMGDGKDKELSLFTNGKAGDRPDKPDTMIAVKRGYPNNNIIQIYEMPYPSFVDIDNDHRTDVVVAPGKGSYPSTTENADMDRTNTIWYYHNDMDTTHGKKAPLFLFKENNFLQSTTFDMGLGTAPCFVDVNKDNVPDLLVGSFGGANDKSKDHFVLYMGDKVNHTFTPVNYNYLNIDSFRFNRISPASGDLNGDGISDLVTGNEFGYVAYYKGTGKGTARNSYVDAYDYKMPQLQYWDSTRSMYLPIRVSTHSKPAIVDIDGDKKADLLIGAFGNGIYASLSYYRNTGNNAEGIPQFTKVTDNFGKIRVAAYSAPCVGDFDNDGKPDLILGSRNNGIKYYSNITSNADSLIPRDTLFYNQTSGQFDGQNSLGTYLTPAAALLDGDKYPDLMIGTMRGGLYYMATQDRSYRSFGSRLGLASVEQESMKGTLYPNPATTTLTFRYQDAPEGERSTIILTDIIGRQIFSRNIILQSGGSERIDIQSLSNGLYIFNIISEKGQNLLNAKVIIQK